MHWEETVVGCASLVANVYLNTALNIKNEMLKIYNFATGHWKKNGGPLKEFCYKNVPLFI